MSNEYLSSDFSYKKYSLEHLEEWINDAMNCENITPQEIYNTIVNCVNDNIEYHKKYLTKNIEVLSLLKGNEPSVSFGTTDKDWEDFWKEQDEISQNYTEEDLNAMCDAAEEKEKCREYNLREAEYYNKRAQMDLTGSAENGDGYVIADGYSTSERNRKTYDQMIAEGWQMTDDGFWIKETDKGTMSVSA
jgi:hypothetical protein